MTSKKARVSNQASGDITQLPHDMFFAAVETTRMPMIVTDPNRDDNPIIFANRAFLEMTGYGLEEIIGRNCRFLQGPETDASIVETLRDSIAQVSILPLKFSTIARTAPVSGMRCSYHPFSTSAATLFTTSPRNWTSAVGVMLKTHCARRKRWKRWGN